MENRDRLLARVFTRLADTLAEDFDIVEFLHGLCADAVQVVGAETAGVMLADPRGGLRLLASSEERMRILELFELQSQQGPCLDAFRTGDTVTATTADGRRRWPLFAPQAAERGFRYMCAVPMQLDPDRLGLLGLLDAAALLASEVITNAVLHARTVVTVTAVRTDPGTVRIDVSDGSPHAPERRQANEEDTNGRGIGLLDALAASWSVRMTEHGKNLSFSLDEARDPWSAAMTTELWAAEL